MNVDNLNQQNDVGISNKMQVLNLTGLQSIQNIANGERIIKGTFEGKPVEQTLSAQQGKGFWFFDIDSSCFVFIPINGNLKFADIN